MIATRPRSLIVSLRLQWASKMCDNVRLGCAEKRWCMRFILLFNILRLMSRTSHYAVLPGWLHLYRWLNSNLRLHTRASQLLATGQKAGSFPDAAHPHLRCHPQSPLGRWKRALPLHTLGRPPYLPCLAFIRAVRRISRYERAESRKIKMLGVLGRHGTMCDSVKMDEQREALHRKLFGGSDVMRKRCKVVDNMACQRRVPVPIW